MGSQSGIERRTKMQILLPFIISSFSLLAALGQPEVPNAEIEEVRQALVENNRKLISIQKAFQSESDATKMRLRSLESDLEESKEELARTRDELAKTKSQLTTSLSSKMSKVETDSSFMMVCGYQSRSWQSLGTVQFDTLTSEYNNPGNMLDISTGVFTSYTAGVYTINYNVLSWINYGGGEVKMIVFHNGVEIPETEIYSYADGHAHDMASRTTIKFLAVGDTLELQLTSMCSGCEPTRITMCVSLNEEWL